MISTPSHQRLVRAVESPAHLERFSVGASESSESASTSSRASHSLLNSASTASGAAFKPCPVRSPSSCLISAVLPLKAQTLSNIIKIYYKVSKET